MKNCIKCNIVKEEEEFHLKSKKTGNTINTCKICSAAYKKKHYNKNKVKYINKAKKRTSSIRAENRFKLFTLLSNEKCVDCGIKNILVLEFDHKDASSKKYNISNCLDLSWETILKEISKCEVRCCNCHRIKTHSQYNTHRLTFITSDN